jgi:hypothetical protein
MINSNQEYTYEILSFSSSCELTVEYLIHFNSTKFNDISQLNNFLFPYFINNGIQKLISSDNPIITENDNKGRETGLGEIGSRLQKKYSDFDVRNYGYSSLSTFIDETAAFDVKKKESTVFVALHSDKDMKKRVKKFAVDVVAEAGTKGIEMGQLGQKIHDEFPSFNVKEFGYATLSKFIYGIKDLKVETSGNNKKIVYIR